MWPPLFLSTALQSHSIQIKSFSRSRCLFHSNFVAKIARDEDFDVGFFFGQFCQTRLGSRWYSSLMIEQVITLQCLCFLFLLAIELRHYEEKSFGSLSSNKMKSLILPTAQSTWQNLFFQNAFISLF
jgi:hypothetical protein